MTSLGSETPFFNLGAHELRAVVAWLESQVDSRNSALIALLCDRDDISAANEALEHKAAQLGRPRTVGQKQHGQDSGGKQAAPSLLASKPSSRSLQARHRRGGEYGGRQSTVDASDA